MGHRGSGPRDDGQTGDGAGPSNRSSWDNGDDLFHSPPQAPLRWQAEARLLLNEVLDKVPPQARGAAHRRALQQVEALAREWGVTEVSAELVGVALGGLSMTRDGE